MQTADYVVQAVDVNPKHWRMNMGGCCNCFKQEGVNGAVSASSTGDTGLVNGNSEPAHEPDISDD